MDWLAWLLDLFRKHPVSTGARGARWEAVAARHLSRRGWRIVSRNWRGSRGEIDIVAWDGDSLVFVEVRARPAAALVGGYHSIGRHKRSVLREACQEYLRRLRPPPRHHRFDVIEISHSSPRDFEVRHFERVQW